MKEELINLKDLLKEYDRLSDDFYNKRTLFNLKVDELCEDYDCVIYPIGLNEEQNSKLDSYEKAKIFFKGNSNIIAKLNKIKKLNSEADRRKILSLYIRYLTKNHGLDYDTAYFFVSNYMILSDAGYYKTVKAENVANNVLRRVSNQVEALKYQGLDSIESTVNAAKKRIYSAEQEARVRLEPYARDVKRGFNDLVEKTKPYVHEGSKGLAKVFAKIADKTKPIDKKKND